MEAKMTSEGLLIPQEWLKHFIDFEVHHNDKAIVILPTQHTTTTLKNTPQKLTQVDPIWALGDDPVSDAVITDASVQHDDYLYHS